MNDDKIDETVNIAIYETLTQNDSKLWDTIEKLVINQIDILGFLNNSDTIEGFQNLNNLILSAGFIDRFFINKNSVQVKNLLNEMASIGFDKNDNCAQDFLYKICNPIVEKYEKENKTLVDSTNLIKFYSQHDPNNLKMSFELNILDFERNPKVFIKNWDSPGSRKILILMYFTKMIEK